MIERASSSLSGDPAGVRDKRKQSFSLEADMSFVRTNGGWGAQDVPYAIDNGSFSDTELDEVEEGIRGWNRQAPTRLIR